MEVKASRNFQVASSITTVWGLLNETEKIADCVPGAQITECIDEDHFKGKVTIKIGPVKAKFNGLVEFTHRDASTHELTIIGKGDDQQGKGGASMVMSLKLEERENGTEVESNMTLSISGKIAQFGTRLIEGVNNKMFDQFIKNFKKLLSQLD